MLTKEAEQCNKNILKWQKKLKQLQDDCTHSTAIKIPKGSTGNWCRDDDSYWHECDCPECGKKWIEDQ